jgi:hypothetical protein
MSGIERLIDNQEWVNANHGMESDRRHGSVCVVASAFT